MEERLLEIIKNFNGELICKEDWGKRKLAYVIQRESRGHYLYMVYTGRSGVVQEMERTLRIQEYLLRYLTVKLEQGDVEQLQRRNAAGDELRRRESSVRNQEGQF